MTLLLPALLLAVLPVPVALPPAAAATGPHPAASGPAAATWETLTTGFPDAIYGLHFIDRSRGFAVGWGSSVSAVILATEDGGESWVGQIPERDSILFSIRFVDRNHGFAVGQVGTQGLLLSTKDRGQSWTTTVLPSTFGLYDVAFPTRRIGFTCGYDGAIFKTTDGGRSWLPLPTGTSSDIFRSLSFVDEHTGYALGGGPFGGKRIYRTTDGGASWELVKSFGNAVVLSAVGFLDAQTGLAAGFRNGAEAVLRTANAGVNWPTAHTGTPGTVLQALDIHGRMAVATGLGGLAHITEDRGLTWQSLPLPTDTTMLCVSVVPGGIFLAGGNGTLHRLLW